MGGSLPLFPPGMHEQLLPFVRRCVEHLCRHDADAKAHMLELVLIRSAARGAAAAAVSVAGGAASAAGGAATDGAASKSHWRMPLMYSTKKVRVHFDRDVHKKLLATFNAHRFVYNSLVSIWNSGTYAYTHRDTMKKTTIHINLRSLTNRQLTTVCKFMFSIKKIKDTHIETLRKHLVVPEKKDSNTFPGMYKALQVMGSARTGAAHTVGSSYLQDAIDDFVLAAKAIRKRHEYLKHKEQKKQEEQEEQEEPKKEQKKQKEEQEVPKKKQKKQKEEQEEPKKKQKDPMRLNRRSKRHQQQESLKVHKAHLNKQHGSLSYNLPKIGLVYSYEELPRNDELTSALRVIRNQLGQFFVVISTATEVDPSNRHKHHQDDYRICSIDPGCRTMMTALSVSMKHGAHVFEFGTSSDADRLFSLCLELDHLTSWRFRKRKSTAAATAAAASDDRKGRMQFAMNARQRRSLKRRCFRLRAKIRNLRADMHNKIAKCLVQQFHVILLPRFNTSSMIRNDSDRVLSNKGCRRLMNWSHAKLRDLIKCKSRHYGNVLVIEASEGCTTKTCSKCGRSYHNHPGRSKVFECTRRGCGYKDDRDVNSTKNILYRFVFDILQKRMTGEQYCALQAHILEQVAISEQVDSSASDAASVSSDSA
jgi:transposase